MSEKVDQVYELLQQVQLEHFHLILRDQLQITRLIHFKHVKPKDLERVGMAKPAIRRLLDAVEHVAKGPVRPPPPVPNLQANIYNDLARIGSKTFSKSILNNAKKMVVNRSKNDLVETPPTPDYSRAVSFLINSTDVEFVKNPKTNEDEILGSGQFGVVKKAIWTTFSRQKITVAVKCLHNNIVDNKSKNPLGDILNEASSMCGLEHEHLIKLYGVLFNTNQQDLNTKLMMVTEYARYGSLQNYLRDHRKSHHSAYLPVKQLFSYVYQIACGMEYLESKKLVHRDLAARNILLYTLEHIKICDFGMTRSVKSSKLNDSRDNDEDDDDKMYAMNDLEKIPCAWYPPESIREHLFSIKSDVWAFGVCIWEIFTECEKQPWPGMNAFQILYKLEIEKARLEQPYLCSSSFYKLVLKCWSYSPSDRPTFRQLKNLIKDIKIVEMKAKLSFTEENKLAIEVGDLITIVDGTPDKYWWKGQNQRSMLVGQFPRALLDPQRPVSKEDISGPLRNSFIHTGHMSSNPSDPKSWGDPGKIDEIFLKNPLSPPDFFVGGDQPELTLDITESVSKPSALSHQTSNDCLTNMLNDINLIDFTEDVMIANDIQITHPNYLSADDTVSSNSFESSQSSPSFPRYFNQQHITKEWQIVTSPTSNVYYNQISNQYLEPVSSTTSQSSTTQCHQPKTLHTSQSFIQPTMARNLSSIGLEKQLHRTISSHIDERSYVNILPTKTEQTPPVQRFSAHDFESPKQPVSVDDLLNKVMRDVLSDLDTIKIKPVK